MDRNEILKKINTLLKDNVYMDNILQYYDNVTYNIRFYMLNQKYQKEVTEIRDSGDEDLKKVIQRLPDDSKIIIAETGVSSKINMKKLTLKTIYPSSINSNSVATYELNMFLQEVGGASLINQITAVSKLVGYDCYLLQPFHIDLWFSGFEQSTGKPIQVIEDKIYTFEVLIADIKTTTSVTGMEYNFTMIPTAIGDFNKSKRLMLDIGELNTTSNIFGDFLTNLEDYINLRFEKENPKLVHYFTSTNPYFKFDKGVIKHLSSKDSIIKYIANKKSNNLKTNSDDMQIIKGITFENYLASTNSENSKNNVSIRPNNEKLLDDLLQDVILCSNGYKNYILRLNYKIHNIGVDNGQMVSSIRADIILTESAYLNYYNKTYTLSGNNAKVADIKIPENSENTNTDTKTNNSKIDINSEKLNLVNLNKEDEYIEEMVNNELYSLLSENRLNKRYEWQFNGRDTNLLEFQSTLDKLWYSNIPLYNADNIKSNSVENSLKIAVDETYKKFLTNAKTSKKIDDFLQFINLTNIGLNGVKNLASDKKIYLDDVYYCIDESVRNSYLSNRPIVEKCNLFSDVALNEQNNNLSLGIVVAKTGYENIHSSGNLVELKLKILGDPYWLGPVEDATLYSNINNGECGKFDNISFRLNTTLGEKPDGTYDIENMVDFSNIYNVIESTSIFEEGKFIQQLRCLVNHAFIHFPRLGV